MIDTEDESKIERREAAIARARECNEGADLCLHLKAEIATIAKSRKLSAADVANASGGTEEEMLRLLQRDHDPTELWRLMEVLRSIGGLMMFAVEHLPDHKKGAVLWASLSGPLPAAPEEPSTPGPK